MQSNPQSPWLALGKHFAGLLRELGDTASAGLQEAGGPVRSAQAGLAQQLKAVLELQQEFNELQAASGLQLLRIQLGLLNPQQSSASMRALLDVQLDTCAKLSEQCKRTLETVAERSHSCIGDLRQAQTADEVSLTLLAFARELGASAQMEAEHSAALLNAANAAGTILAQRVLDDLIAVPCPAPGSASPT